MIRITVEVDAFPDDEQGLKETIACAAEKFGPVTITDIEADTPEQMQISYKSK